MKRWMLCLLLFLLPLAAFAEELTLSPGETRGYMENSIEVSAPDAGILMLRVYDDYNVYRTMTFQVQKGTNTLTWDGLAENRERITAKTYTLQGELTTADTVYTAETSMTVKQCKQALLFALPSSAVCYRDDESWFAELCLVREGDCQVEVYAADNLQQPLSTQRKAGGEEPFKFRWKPKDLPAGEYVLRFYPRQNPEYYAYDIPVTLVDGSAPVLQVTETETIMPTMEDSDETIWNIMMQPSAVISLRVATGHQEVYAQPSENSDVLGTLHGLSQAVQVVDIRDDGWVRVMAWNHEDGSPVDGFVPQSRLMMVEPNHEYGLLLDKNAQTLTVFYQGKCLTTLDVSTGLMAKNKLFRETPAGSYLTLEHMSGFASESYYYEYPIRYDGGNLLHQLGLKKKGGRNDFSEQTPQLGTKASHGCIRLPNQVNEDGVNAYWMWTHLPYHTRLIILDDPEQRVLNHAMAEAGITSMKKDMPTPAQTPVLAEDETEIVITLGGDAVVGTRETWWRKETAFPAYLEAHGMAYPFSGLYDIFSKDDMTFVNLECVLKANGAGEDKDKLYRFRGLPEYTDVLKEGSIEQVNIANNHYVDYGGSGRTATREALEAAGMPYSGYGYTYVWECKGYRIGFAGCRETVYKQDPSVIARDIAALQNDGCQVILFTCHWGTEYSGGHNELQEQMARAAVEAGADIVVGGHPHVVQGIDTMDNALVLYSLGNLMFGGTIDMTTFDAALAQVRLRFDENGYQGCGLELIPILTSGAAPANDYRPVVAQGEDKERILTKIQVDSGVKLQDSMWFPVK